MLALAAAMPGLALLASIPGAKLSEAAEIRALTAVEAAEHRPASVEGVVTFAHAAHFGAYAFVQDESAGIYFPLPAKGATLSPGDIIRVTGSTRPGEFAPYLQASDVEVLGLSKTPEPVEVSIPEMMDGHLDSQWVRTRGRARLSGADQPADVHTLDIVGEQVRLRIDLPSNVPADQLAALWGAQLEITGVCATLFNEAKQIVGVRMMVSSIEQLRVLEPPPAQPFDLEVQSISDLLRFRPNRADPQGLAHVKGVVIHREARGVFTVQDPTGGVLVYSAEAPPLGARVDLVGFLASSRLTPLLRDTLFRLAPDVGAPDPSPLLITNLLDTKSANRLVTTEVVLLDRIDGPQELTLYTRHADGIVRVTLASDNASRTLESARTGARLRVTGVLQLFRSYADMHRNPNSFALSPGRAQLRLRSAQDIQVVQEAPFWTFKRGLSVFVGLGVCMGLGALWLIALRRRVAEQTTVISRQLDNEKALTKQAESANLAKSAFLATISHELRTPMNGVLGVAELLGQDESLPPKQKDLVRIIQRSGGQLLQLLHDLLDFSKIEANALTLDPQPTRLTEVVHTAQTLLQARAEDKGLRLSSHVNAACPPWVLVDHTRLLQVLLNLLSNAIKFTQTGSVELRLSQRSEGEFEVRVTDTGIGLAPDAKGRLFQRFSQADASIARRYGGTGLGLAICRGIVEAMQGSIDVDSTPGEGACFWFTFRAPTTQPLGTQDSKPEPTADILSSSSRVLLVDDHPINLKVGERMLRALGLTPDLADSGEQALARLQEQAYDVVLMDVHMPGMDGLTCTKTIRRTLPTDQQPYILAVTADAAVSDRAACLATGMDGHLAKPLTLATLKAALSQVGARAAVGPDG